MNLHNCVRNYLNLNFIKRSFRYKDKLVCVGKYGGFACLNLNDFSLDSLFTLRLNTDFFNDAQIYRDTLFGQLFNELYFWNGSWQKYPGTHDINIFDLVYEDDTLAVCSENRAECEAFLIFLNKLTHELRYYFNPDYADYTTSLIKYNKYFFITTKCYHLFAKGNCFFLKNIPQLPGLPKKWIHERSYEQSLEMMDAYFSRIGNHRDYLRPEIDSDFLIPYSLNYEYSAQDLNLPAMHKIMNGSFLYHNRFYHIVDDKKNEKVTLTTIINDTLTMIDSLNDLRLNTIIDYKGIRILNESYYEGLAVIRNDTIYNINFQNCYPEINEFRFDYDKVIPLSGKDWNIRHYKYDFQPKSGRPSRSVKFKYKDYIILGHHNGGMDGNYIIHNGVQRKLKLTDDWNFINNIFSYDSRLFLSFQNLGSMYHNYWLIEITDLERFTSIYSYN